MVSTTASFRELYGRFGRAYRIDPRLIEAMVRQESGGHAAAFRYERHLHDASFGLMQVLAKTARALKMIPDGAMDAVLCEPEVGLRAGVAVLAENLNNLSAAAQMARSHGDYERLFVPLPFPIAAAICRYNGGYKGNPGEDGKTLRNTDYLAGVTRHFTEVCRELDP